MGVGHDVRVGGEDGGANPQAQSRFLLSMMMQSGMGLFFLNLRTYKHLVLVSSIFLS